MLLPIQTMLISQAGLELLEHAKSAVKNGLNVETRLLRDQENMT